MYKTGGDKSVQVVSKLNSLKKKKNTTKERISSDQFNHTSICLNSTIYTQGPYSLLQWIKIKGTK